jgi:hypothetical protein
MDKVALGQVVSEYFGFPCQEAKSGRRTEWTQFGPPPPMWIKKKSFNAFILRRWNLNFRALNHCRHLDFRQTHQSYYVTAVITLRAEGLSKRSSTPFMGNRLVRPACRMLLTVSCCVYSSTSKTDAICSSETLSSLTNTRHYNPEGRAVKSPPLGPQI